ncbi:MAG: indole-3-glycerol phosphate synthase TrpC [Candidatus Omnitrophota bacterium]|nr:indole-3-glycerol phosphate synthase TrpC [Candidatus Omnitrophota bacterium]
MAKDFLTEIIEQKKSVLKERNTFFSYWQLRLRSQRPHLNRFFKDSISQPDRLNLIAEIKKASPSRGIIRYDFNAVNLARIYQDSGADALSVLTEEQFFKGNIAFINSIRKKSRLPILRKDFIIDDFQIYESYVYGADAILLIAQILEREQLANFINLSQRLGMDCLVEVHNEEDLKKALDTDARVIGINNRDLRTLKVDLQTTARLRSFIPSDKIVVSESGIHTVEDIAFINNLGVNAVLIGEAFLESYDIPARIKSLMQR